MRMLGEDYGVSYTHFRRLCSRALGGKAKSELRNWRMAQSLLNSVEGHENITQLAVNHGYSSPSHFSSEIKRADRRFAAEIIKYYSIGRQMKTHILLARVLACAALVLVTPGYSSEKYL